MYQAITTPKQIKPKHRKGNIVMTTIYELYTGEFNHGMDADGEAENKRLEKRRTKLINKIEADGALFESGKNKGEMFCRKDGKYHLGLVYWYRPVLLNGHSGFEPMDREKMPQAFQVLKDAIADGVFDEALDQIRDEELAKRHLDQAA